ncbi:MAG: SRPBCC family protein [Ilumatobacteraceae bacterium]
MDVHATLEAPCTADRLFAFVDDLGEYPAWMDLAHRVEALPADASGEPAWQVELRARVGPFARSKRLRMVRTEHDPQGHRVVFERAEHDGRSHSPWVLRADIDELDGTSTLHMHLRYGGGLWTGGVLERVLADQITNGRERLRDLVRSTH